MACTQVPDDPRICSPARLCNWQFAEDSAGLRLEIWVAKINLSSSGQSAPGWERVGTWISVVSKAGDGHHP